MIKVILFDFWGTLVENGVWSPIKQVKNILNIKVVFPEYVVRMERAMMTSKFPELKEAFYQICTEFKAECTPEQMEALVGLWNASWMLAQPYPETEEVLSKLKKKYKLVLVSNTDCFSEEKVLEKFNLKKYFDHIFLSYKIGLIKTDKSFFETVLSTLNAFPEDCVMVGDSLQSDVMAANQVGVKAVLVDPRNTRDYHPKITSLTELEGALSKL
ncbi:HAD family hydrolase [Candidatus Woesearchaeota archaeon]|nr:HAD family hydrolase [Candidatus Woesearchaeota archaeon]